MDKVRLNEKLLKSLNSVLFMPVAELIPKAGLTNTTWYSIMANPVSATVQQLISIANGLHIPVHHFFSIGNGDIIGKREDYMADSYTPCYYDAAKLQQIVSTRSDATWQKASEATGITPTRLRNSLLGETRTPLVRFLSVCEVFDIDPFTILIDPNPRVNSSKRKSSAQRRSSNEDLHSEISTLREDLRHLTSVVNELTSKYESLLKAHDALASRVQVNIDTVHDSYIGIAAEQGPGYGKR